MKKIMKILIILLNAGFVKKHMKKVKLKVKDHNHITRKYQGPAHQECNLNLSLTKKSLLCFVICETMIHFLSFKKLENITSKCYTKSDRKIYEFYYSTTKKEIH